MALNPAWSRLSTQDRRRGVAEVILALGATVDGTTTTHWLTEKLMPLGVTVSRVGEGVPMGGAMDVLDDGKLAAALRARRPD
jgi:recombination protein RecR